MANAYSTPLNYGRTITTTDTAQYIGAIQNAMQQKFDVNLAKIDDLIAKVSSVPLVRDKDKQYLGERLQGLLSMVDANSKVDLTDNTVARQITNYISTAIDDNVKTQIANSKKIYQFNSEIQELKEKKPEQYNSANHAYALAKGGFDSYMAGDTDELGSLNYSPYSDVTKTALDKIKELKELRGEQKISMPDPNNPGMLIERTIKGLTQEEIFKYIPNILTSKEQEQLKINGWAKYKDNIQEANTAVEAVKEGYFKEIDQNIDLEKSKMENTSLSDSERTEARARYNAYVQDKKEKTESFSNLKKDDPESLGYFLESRTWKNGIAEMAQAKWSIETKKDDYYFEKQKLDLEIQKNQREEEEHRAKMQKEYGIGANGQAGSVDMSGFSQSPIEGKNPDELNVFDNLKKDYENTNKQFNATINSAVNNDITPGYVKTHYAKEMRKRGYDINGKVIDKKLASKTSLSMAMEQSFNNSGLANIHPDIAKQVSNLSIKRNQYSKEYNGLKTTNLTSVFKADPDRYVDYAKEVVKRGAVREPELAGFFTSFYDDSKEVKEKRYQDRVKAISKLDSFAKANGGFANLKKVLSSDKSKLEQFSDILSEVNGKIGGDTFFNDIFTSFKNPDLKRESTVKANEDAYNKSKKGGFSGHFTTANVGTLSNKASVESLINKIPQTDSGNIFDKERPVSFYKNQDGSITITQNSGYANTKEGGYLKKPAQVVVTSKDAAYIELQKYIDNSDRVDSLHTTVKIKPSVNPSFINSNKTTVVNTVGTSINNMPASLQKIFEAPPINFLTKIWTKKVYQSSLGKNIEEDKINKFIDLLSNNLNDFKLEVLPQNGLWAVSVKDKTGDIVYEKSLGVQYLESDISHAVIYQPQIFISDALLKNLKQEPENIDKFIKLMQ